MTWVKSTMHLCMHACNLLFLVMRSVYNIMGMACITKELWQMPIPIIFIEQRNHSFIFKIRYTTNSSPILWGVAGKTSETCPQLKLPFLNLNGKLATFIPIVQIRCKTKTMLDAGNNGRWKSICYQA